MYFFCFQVKSIFLQEIIQFKGYLMCLLLHGLFLSISINISYNMLTELMLSPWDYNPLQTEKDQCNRIKNNSTVFWCVWYMHWWVTLNIYHHLAVLCMLAMDVDHAVSSAEAWLHAEWAWWDSSRSSFFGVFTTWGRLGGKWTTLRKEKIGDEAETATTPKQLVRFKMSPEASQLYNLIFRCL